MGHVNFQKWDTGGGVDWSHDQPQTQPNTAVPMPTAANPDPAHTQLSLVPPCSGLANLFPPNLKHGKPSFGLSLMPARSDVRDISLPFDVF